MFFTRSVTIIMIIIFVTIMEADKYLTLFIRITFKYICRYFYNFTLQYEYIFKIFDRIVLFEPQIKSSTYPILY